MTPESKAAVLARIEAVFRRMLSAGKPVAIEDSGRCVQLPDWINPSCLGGIVGRMKDAGEISPPDLEQLAETEADAVAERLPNRPRLVDRVELARLLGHYVPSIQRWQQAGAIALARFCRRCLDDPGAVIQSRMEAKGGADHGV